MKNGIGGACGTCEGRCIQGFSGGGLMEREFLEDVGADMRIIVKWIFKNRRGR